MVCESMHARGEPGKRRDNEMLDLAIGPSLSKLDTLQRELESTVSAWPFPSIILRDTDVAFYIQV